MKQTMDSSVGGWWQEWRGGGDCLCDLPPSLGSPSWSRAPSSPHSSGRMSPVCESPPPSPRTPPPLGPWLPRVAEVAGVPFTREDQRSLALSSVKKNKNTYVAVPRAEVLQDNVYFARRPKKSFSFSSLRHPRQRRAPSEDSSFSSRSTSHDEVPGPHAAPGSSYTDEDRLSLGGDKNSEDCLWPFQDTEAPPTPARILPRARLRRRSIAAPGEFSLVSGGAGRDQSFTLKSRRCRRRQ